jgi:hypothetical protein
MHLAGAPGSRLEEEFHLTVAVDQNRGSRNDHRRLEVLPARAGAARVTESQILRAAHDALIRESLVLIGVQMAGGLRAPGDCQQKAQCGKNAAHGCAE